MFNNPASARFTVNQSNFDYFIVKSLCYKMFYSHNNCFGKISWCRSEIDFWSIPVLFKRTGQDFKEISLLFNLVLFRLVLSRSFALKQQSRSCLVYLDVSHPSKAFIRRVRSSSPSGLNNLSIVIAQPNVVEPVEGRGSRGKVAVA